MKKRSEVAKKFGLIGAGTGLTLFAFFGLLQGSMIGGAIGLDIVNSLMRETAGPSILSRVIIGASMLAGGVLTGVVFVVACTSVAWFIGYLVGLLAEPKVTPNIGAYQEKKN